MQKSVLFFIALTKSLWLTDDFLVLLHHFLYSLYRTAGSSVYSKDSSPSQHSRGNYTRENQYNSMYELSKYLLSQAKVLILKEAKALGINAEDLFNQAQEIEN